MQLSLLKERSPWSRGPSTQGPVSSVDTEPLREMSRGVVEAETWPPPGAGAARKAPSQRPGEPGSVPQLILSVWPPLGARITFTDVSHHRYETMAAENEYGGSQSPHGVPRAPRTPPCGLGCPHSREPSTGCWGDSTQGGPGRLETHEVPAQGRCSRHVNDRSVRQVHPMKDPLRAGHLPDSP